MGWDNKLLQFITLLRFETRLSLSYISLPSSRRRKLEVLLFLFAVFPLPAAASAVVVSETKN